MNYYALEYTVAEDFINRRAPCRPAHLASWRVRPWNVVVGREP